VRRCRREEQSLPFLASLNPSPPFGLALTLSLVAGDVRFSGRSDRADSFFPHVLRASEVPPPIPLTPRASPSSPPRVLCSPGSLSFRFRAKPSATRGRQARAGRTRLLGLSIFIRFEPRGRRANLHLAALWPPTSSKSDWSIIPVKWPCSTSLSCLPDSPHRHYLRSFPALSALPVFLAWQFSLLFSPLAWKKPSRRSEPVKAHARSQRKDEHIARP
jgi:hypothetical protein